MNIFEIIHDFNERAGFLDGEYNAFLEASFQIEEAVEGFHFPDIREHLGSLAGNPKDLSREILDPCKNAVITDVDALDKACDSIVFAVGSMAKLGLTPAMIEEALLIVMNHNTAKLQAIEVDAEGKLKKPEHFVGPEAQLQELLDRR